MAERKLPPLSPSHQAWLDLHPHRTREWLKAAISEGFEVHHVDGNRENNAPSNLVLIELTDHRMLHTGNRRVGYVFAGFQHKTWARRLEHSAWAYRQERLRRACRATMHWLDGGFWPKTTCYTPRKIAKAEMAEWWKTWGGGRRWHFHTSRRLNVYGVGLAEIPRENHQLGIAFPYFADLDQSEGWGEG